MIHDPELARAFDHLTLKQREAVKLTANFHSNKEAARLLGVSPSTIEQRLRGARQKLGAIDRRQLQRIYHELQRSDGSIFCLEVKECELVPSLGRSPNAFLRRLRRLRRDPFLRGLSFGFSLGVATTLISGTAGLLVTKAIVVTT
jgi:DNA-binding CsgD family transcriptional regulator